jgi:hypothetical protein
MIKPPFTIIIVKNSHHPITIRISSFFSLLIFIIIPILFTIIGFGLSSVWRECRENSNGIFPSHVKISSDKLSLKTTPLVKEAAENTDSPEFSDLFVSRLKNGSIEITFSLNNIRSEISYIWTIINPDDSSTGEMVISPRNPTFRGFPLDFRNGLLYKRYSGKQCKITLSDEINGIAVRKIKILVYSSSGKIELNKEFGIETNSSL